MNVEVRPGGPQDAGWVARLLAERWGTPRMILHGEEYDLTAFPALVAWDGERRVGLATVRLDPSGDAELMSLDSLQEGRGVDRRSSRRRPTGPAPPAPAACGW